MSNEKSCFEQNKESIENVKLSSQSVGRVAEMIARDLQDYSISFEEFKDLLKLLSARIEC